MRKINVWVILMLIPMLYGCRLRRPESVLSPKKMEQFLYDYHLAQAIGQDLPQNERYKTNAYIDWAYSRNNISKDDFERSLIWYTRNPKELSKIYKRLSNRVDDEYKVVSKSLSQIEKKSFSIQSGDSVDLWYMDRTALLNTSAYMNKLTYHINRDTTFYKGDTVSLGLYGTFVSVDSGVPQYAHISLSAYYDDGITTADTIIRSNAQVYLSVVLDTAKNLSNISGAISYLDYTDNRNALLILSDIELMRYHEKYVPDTAVASDSIDSQLPSAEL